MIENLPEYRCHKIVRAAKITEISGFTLVCGEIKDQPKLLIDVTQEWLNRHMPQVDGYYVVYSDDYASYSPAEQFEAGYTLKE